MTRGQQRLVTAAVLIAATLAALLTLLRSGPSCGHDFEFHLLSWFDVATAWHSGLLAPHWVASANFGAGEPRLIFYPPTSWILGAALGSAAGWTAAPILYSAVCLLCAGAAMYRLARHWFSTMVATVAGCLAIANPYTLFVVYERTAYGELLAAAIIPLALLHCVQKRPRVTTLALLVAGMWMVNAPSGVMLCYALLWIALGRLALERAWSAPLHLAGGTGLGLALAGFYLFPAAWQQRWVEIARALAPGLRVDDSFLFGHTGEFYHDQVLHTASWIACVLIAICVAGILLWRDALHDRGTRRIVSLTGVICFLLLPISAPLWHHTPRLAFLQFPWRWMMVLGPIATLMLTGVLARWLPRVWLMAVAGVLCLCSIAVCTRQFYQVCDDDDVVPAQLARLHGGGERGADEYTPRDADNSEVPQALPLVRLLKQHDAEMFNGNGDEAPQWQQDAAAELPAEIHVQQWCAEHRDFTIDAPARGYAVLRLMDYHAWRVLRNGRSFPTRPHREDGLMTIPVRAGHSHIEITWRITRDVWVGRAVSLLALAIFALAFWLERRVRPKTTPAATT